MRDQQHADAGGEQTRLQVLGAQRRGDGLRLLRLERHRQRAVAELAGEVVGGPCGEVAGDLRVAGEHALDLRRGDDRVVEHHGDQAVAVRSPSALASQAPPSLLERLAGQVGPLLLPVAGEVEADHPLAVSGRARALASLTSVPCTLATSSRYLHRALTGDDLLVLVADRAGRPLVELVAGDRRHVELHRRGQRGDLTTGQRAERLERVEQGRVGGQVGRRLERARRLPGRRADLLLDRGPLLLDALRHRGRGGRGARGRARRVRWSPRRSASAWGPEPSRPEPPADGVALGAPAEALAAGRRGAAGRVRGGTGRRRRRLGRAGRAAVGRLEHLAEAQLGGLADARRGRRLWPGSEMTMLRLPSVTTSASETPWRVDPAAR